MHHDGKILVCGGGLERSKYTEYETRLVPVVNLPYSQSPARKTMIQMIKYYCSCYYNY